MSYSQRNEKIFGCEEGAWERMNFFERVTSRFFSIFELSIVPDLTWKKYSAGSEQAAEKTMLQHYVFWSQLLKRGRLLGERYHLIYEYHPERAKGYRIRSFLVIGRDTLEDHSVEEMIKTSPVSEDFILTKISYRKFKENSLSYSCAAHLRKKEQRSRISNSVEDNSSSDCMTDTWKMNGKSRLYQMRKLMENMNVPCVYCVTIEPAVCPESLSENGGIHADIQAWAEKPETVRLLLNTIASEENYEIAEEPSGVFMLRNLLDTGY